MFKIQTLNNISVRGLERLPRDRFEVASDLSEPDGILVRSADMHKLTIPESVRAIGRAGAGTNNIPVPALSSRGVVVFNAPGANANAVKELVLAAMLMASRNLVGAVRFVEGLSGDDSAIHKLDRRRQEKLRWLRAADTLPGRHRPRRDRCQSRQRRPPTRLGRARLRPRHHRAEREVSRGLVE